MKTWPIGEKKLNRRRRAYDASKGTNHQMPHCNQRLLDAQYIVGTIKCSKCKQIIKLVIKDIG